MLRTRIIPTLLLSNDALVKTVKFKNPTYIGDPINTVRIFNELEVDELIFLDIEVNNKNKNPNTHLLREIANECFMPLAYGGGLKDFKSVSQIFEIGFEKIVINSACFTNPEFLVQIAKYYGSQAIVASVDVKKNLWGTYEVWVKSGTKNTKMNPIDYCKELENIGVGEILITSIDKEGSWSGFDLELTRSVSESVSIPVIAHGGAGNLKHISEVVKKGKASAVALGSMVVYQQKNFGVLVNFPDKLEIYKMFE